MHGDDARQMRLSCISNVLGRSEGLLIAYIRQLAGLPGLISVQGRVPAVASSLSVRELIARE
jgi:hypothetical protein